jgi:predicted HTH domain antitoxin
MLGERVVTVSARIPRSQLREVEKLAEARGMDKSSIVRALLDMGIREEKLRQALELIREGKATVWRASEIAGLDYREMLAALRTHNVPFPLSVQDMELELKEISRRK